MASVPGTPSTVTGEANFFATFDKQLRDKLIAVMAEQEPTPDGMRIKYLNWNHYFACLYPDSPDGQAKQKKFVDEMQDLYEEVIKVAPGPPTRQEPVTILPAGPRTDEAAGGTGEPVRMTLHLWKLPFLVPGFIRGATNSKHVLENLSAFIVSGNKTSTYPIEVSPLLLGATVGAQIDDFSIGVSVGNAVVMASYLFVHNVLEEKIWDTVGPDDRKTLAIRIRQCLSLTAIWKWASDLRACVFDSISTKQAAARRAKTSVLGLLAAFTILIEQDLAKPGQRRSRHELLLDHTRWHNKQEKSRACRLSSTEIRAMQIITQWGPGSKSARTLDAIWGATAPAQSSVSAEMIASDYLDISKGTVAKEENAVWHNILSPTCEKIHQYLLRCEGLFQFSVEQVVKAGRKPNLYSRADSFRDSDKELGWKIAALKVYVWSDMCKNNSPARVAELQECNNSQRVGGRCGATQG